MLTILGAFAAASYWEKEFRTEARMREVEAEQTGSLLPKISG